MTAPVKVDPSLLMHYINNPEILGQNLVFNVIHVSSEFEMRVIPTTTSFREFSAIDAEPMFTDQKIERISEMQIFKPMVKTQEILIGPKSVPEALDYILKLQDPKQKEIRENHRKEQARKEIRAELNGKPKEEFIAQIISIAG